MPDHFSGSTSDLSNIFGMSWKKFQNKTKNARTKAVRYRTFEYFVLAHLIISIIAKTKTKQIKPKNGQSPKMTKGITSAMAVKPAMILVRIDVAASLLNSFG